MIKFNESTIKEVSSISLAFVGDAVHTLFVRNKITSENILPPNKQHIAASKLCCAKNQAKVFEKILPLLNDKETEIALRARNAKAHHTAKNASEEDYKKATAFEAVLGYNFLLGKQTRLNELFEISLEEKC